MSLPRFSISALVVLPLVSCSVDASRLRATAGRDAAGPMDGSTPQPDVPGDAESDAGLLTPLDGMQDTSLVWPDGAVVDTSVPDVPQSFDLESVDATYDVPEGSFTEAGNAAPEVPNGTGGTGGAPDLPSETGGTGGSFDASTATGGIYTPSIIHNMPALD